MIPASHIQYARDGLSPAPKGPLRFGAGRGDPFTTGLRYEFFCAVDEVAPDVAGEMVETIGPVFERLAEGTTEGDLREFASVAREHEEFLTKWRKWAQRYGLHRDSWILDRVLTLLPAFLRNPDIRPSFAAVPLLAAYPAPGRQITPPGPYRCGLESRADYMKRINEYADLVEDVARATGWESAPAKQLYRLHLRWLARFQVGGEPMKAIAEAEGVGLRHVEKVVREMAAMIDLTRRTDTPP